MRIHTCNKYARRKKKQMEEAEKDQHNSLEKRLLVTEQHLENDFFPVKQCSINQKCAQKP